MKRNIITVIDIKDPTKNFSFDYIGLSKEKIDFLKNVFSAISEKSENLCIKITEPEKCPPPTEGDYVYVSQTIDYDPRAWVLRKYVNADRYSFKVDGGYLNRSGWVNFVIPAKHFKIDDMGHSIAHAFEIKRKDDNAFEVVLHE